MRFKGRESAKKGAGMAESILTAPCPKADYGLH